jgi:hypothetical protein
VNDERIFYELKSGCIADRDSTVTISLSASLIVGNDAGQVSINPAQVTVTATSAQSPPLSGVVSRKNHAGTDFDILLPSEVECRTGGASGDYKMVFTFVNDLSSVGSASVTSGIGSVSKIENKVGTASSKFADAERINGISDEATGLAVESSKRSTLSC